MGRYGKNKGDDPVTGPEVEDTQMADPKIEKVVAKKLVVAPGKSFTTKSGLRGPGDEMTVDMIAGGAEQLAHMAKLGYLVEI